MGKEFQRWKIHFGKGISSLWSFVLSLYFLFCFAWIALFFFFFCFIFPDTVALSLAFCGFLYVGRDAATEREEVKVKADLGGRCEHNSERQ